MPDDPHARIRAALTAARLEVARAAHLRSPGRWRVDSEPWATNGVGVVDERGESVGVAIGSYVAAHIAANDPATVIRATEAALRMLERHAPDSYGAHCMHCRERCDCMDMTQGDTYEELGEAWSNCTHGSEPWPCPDVRDLADMAGVDVGGGT